MSNQPEGLVGNQYKLPGKEFEPLPIPEFQKTIDNDNPWIKLVEDQGVLLGMASEFLYKDGDPGEQDNRTKLTGETDDYRETLAKEFFSCLGQNGKWAIFRTDVDNVKGANNIAHQFGNIAIAQGAAAITRALHKISFNKGTKVYLMRQAEADEATIIILNSTDEELKEVENNLITALQPINVVIPEHTIPHTFSSTMAMVKSGDPRLTEQDIEADKVYFTKNSKPPYKCFNKIMGLADDEIRDIKAIKDLKRFPIGLNKLLSPKTTSDEFVNIMTEALGGTRISHRLLSLVLKAYGIKIRLSDLTLSPQEPIIPETDLDQITNVEEFVALMKKYLETITKQKLANPHTTHE